MISGVNSISSNKSGNISEFEATQRKALKAHHERLIEDQESPFKIMENVENYLRELENRVSELEENVVEEEVPPLTTKKDIVLLDTTEVDLAVIVSKINEIILRLN